MVLGDLLHSKRLVLGELLRRCGGGGMLSQDASGFCSDKGPCAAQGLELDSARACAHSPLLPQREEFGNSPPSNDRDGIPNLKHHGVCLVLGLLGGGLFKGGASQEPTVCTKRYAEALQSPDATFHDPRVVGLRHVLGLATR